MIEECGGFKKEGYYERKYYKKKSLWFECENIIDEIYVNDELNDN